MYYYTDTATVHMEAVQENEVSIRRKAVALLLPVQYEPRALALVESGILQGVSRVVLSSLYVAL